MKGISDVLIWCFLAKNQHLLWIFVITFSTAYCEKKNLTTLYRYPFCRCLLTSTLCGLGVDKEGVNQEYGPISWEKAAIASWKSWNNSRIIGVSGEISLARWNSLGHLPLAVGTFRLRARYFGEKSECGNRKWFTINAGSLGEFGLAQCCAVGCWRLLLLVRYGRDKISGRTSSNEIGFSISTTALFPKSRNNFVPILTSSWGLKGGSH